jgi:ABC-2 type transport system permease protein
MRLFKLLRGIFMIALQRELAYRANLIFEAVQVFVGTAAGLLALLAVFSHTKSLAGWTLAETIVLLGAFQIITGLLQTFVLPNLSWFAASKVMSGELDDLLLRPVSSLFMASLGTCQPWALSGVALGMVIIAIGAAQAGVLPTVASASAALLLLAVGAVLAWSSRVLLACLAFWAPGFEPDVLYSAVWQLGRYPVNIYHPAIRWLLTYVVPVAFIAAVPARTLTRGANPLLLVGGLAAAGASVWMAQSVWQAGLRRYTSATS